MADSSSLLCEENLSGLDVQDQADEYQQGIDNDDDEYVQMLLDREINSPRFTGFGQPNDFLMNSYSTKQCRSNAIEWILNTRALFGFRIQTAYLSVTYFDRYLSKTLLEVEKNWIVRVVSMVCLSLAAKMEEIVVPALPDFPMDHHRFDGGFIERTEISVLITLEWRMHSITPFCYIHYFISKFFNQYPQTNLRDRVSELIMAAIKDMNLMTHRPSAIAGAATLVVLDENLSREAVESKINALSLNGFPQIVDVLFCYNKLQELERQKVHLPNHPIKSPDLSPNQLRGRSSVNRSNKRKRRLDFSDLE